MGATLNLKPATPKLRLSPAEKLFLDPIQGNITCRACDAVESVSVGHPALLCTVCLADLIGSTARVTLAYADAMTAFFRASEAMEELARGSEWYAKTEVARANMDVAPAAFARGWERARDGEHAAIVAARENMDRAAIAMRHAEQRYIAAQPELYAARAFLGEPVGI